MGTFYKYTSFERGRYILRNKCLPIGHISNYNDPYECLIDCIDEELMSLNRHMSDEQKKEWIKHIITKISDKGKWSNDMRNVGISAIAATYGVKALASFNIFGAILLLGGAFAYSAIVGNEDNDIQLTTEHVNKYIQELLPCLANTYTSCMSKSYEEILLWSHYADSHKGIVIGFNADKHPFVDNPPISMDYSDERFTLDADKLLTCDIHSDIKSILLRKNKVWKYEKECRFLFDVQNNPEQIIWYDNYDNPIIRLDDDAVNSVYFGSRVSAEKINQIKDILSSQERLESIKLYKCKLCDTNYGLQFTEIK